MNNHRLAKLYGVKGLPFPVEEEWYYWLCRLNQLGIEFPTGKKFFEWWNGVVKNG